MSTLKEHKKFLFQLNHPAHFHLYRNLMGQLYAAGYEIFITAKDKDILRGLLAGYSVTFLSDVYRKKNIFSISVSLLKRDYRLFKYVNKIKPHLMIGTSPEIGHISLITRIPSVFLGEDDINLSYMMYLGALTCYPMFSTVLSPHGVNNGIFNPKTIHYNGIQKLAYLHPAWFNPDRSKVVISPGQKYFMIRLSDMNSYHDFSNTGLTDEIVRQIINMLQPWGRILISSARSLPVDFEPYRFNGKIEDIHHYLYFSDMLISDSQSMSVEAALLGTPNIRFNRMIGKISILNELENKYRLTVGINASQPRLLFEKITEWLSENSLQKAFKAQKGKLIADKIDVTSFLFWFISNYPESKQIMLDNPSYQDQFRRANMHSIK